MLNDDDAWPVTCANCGHVMNEPIGRLRVTADLQCPHCCMLLKFYRQEFTNAIEEARNLVAMVAKNSQWTVRT